MSSGTRVAERFPEEVIVALHSAGVTVTCMPVQIEKSEWCAAFFYIVASNAPCVQTGKLAGGPFSVVFDADLHQHEHGTAIEIGLHITTPIEPLQGTVVFLTGHSATHFDAVKMLSSQDDIPVFFGDQYCTLLYQQRVPLGDEHRAGFSQLLNEAVNHDALIRLTGRYDADAVFADTLAERQIT